MLYKNLFLLAITIFSTQCQVRTLFNKPVNKLEVSIEFEKDTFYLGEPFWAILKMHNKTNKEVEIGIGVNERARNLDRFDIKIVNENGDTLKKRQNMSAISGQGSSIKLAPGQSYTCKHFITKYENINEVGKYQLISVKDFIIPKDLILKGIYFNYIHPKDVKHINKLFCIVNDGIGLGKFIDNLVNEIELETLGTIVENGSLKLGGNRHVEISEKLRDNLLKLDHIRDERIVPFLARSYFEKRNLPSDKLIYLLKNFPDDNLAFKALKIAANGPENTKCTVTEDSINVVWTAGDERQVALLGILQAKSEESLQFLMSKLNDDYPHEKYMLLSYAKFLPDKDKAIRLCEVYLEDKNKIVRKKAAEVLSLLKDK